MSDLYISRVANGWTISEDLPSETHDPFVRSDLHIARTVEELTALVAKLVQTEKGTPEEERCPYRSESPLAEPFAQCTLPADHEGYHR